MSDRGDAAQAAMDRGYRDRARRFTGPNPFGRLGSADKFLATAYQAGWVRRSAEERSRQSHS